MTYEDLKQRLALERELLKETKREADELEARILELQKELVDWKKRTARWAEEAMEQRAHREHESLT